MDTDWFRDLISTEVIKKAQALTEVPICPTHYVAFGLLPKQTSEGDDGWHAGAVEEEDGR